MADMEKPSIMADEEASQHDSPPLHIQLFRAMKNGGGMFTEAYFVFAFGQLSSVWKLAYPQCTKDVNCNAALNSISWVQIACIIFSQLTFGIIADVIGRRRGAMITSALLLIGAVLITISFGSNATPGSNQSVSTLTGQFIMMNIALAIFSLGIGGEYIVASAMAAERSEHGESSAPWRGLTRRKLKLKRVAS